jgi:hypothetical protein
MEITMSDRLLRHIPSGTLYIWQPAYAQRKDFEEVVEEVVEEVPAEVVEPVKPRTRRVKALDPQPVVQSEVVVVEEERIQEDASRDLP